MAGREFLAAEALTETIRLYGKMQAGGQAVIDALEPAAAAAPDVLALAGLNPLYISETTANPATWTSGGKTGAKRTAEGGWTRLEWTGSWVARGSALASVGQLGLITSALGNTKAGLGAKALADGPQFADGHRWVPRSVGFAPVDTGTVVQGSDCVWIRQFVGALYVTWFDGVYGDGTQDDAPGFRRAILAAKGRVLIITDAPVRWTLKSRVPDEGVDTFAGCLRFYDNSTYEGTGVGSTLYLGAGTMHSAEFSATTGPHIFSRTTLAKNVTFRNLPFDGGPDLLSESDTRRNSCAIFGFGGGTNVLIDHCPATNFAGGQVYFFPGDHGLDIGVTVQDSRLWNNGSAKFGNFNDDHSSIYLNGKGNRLRRVRIGCDEGRRVMGTGFEIHGEDYLPDDVQVTRYMRTWYIESDKGRIENVFLNNVHGIDVTYGYGFGLDNSVGTIHLKDCSLQEGEGGDGNWFIEAPKMPCDHILYENVNLNGKYDGPGTQAMQLNLTKNFRMLGGSISGFAGRAVVHSGTDIGGGYVARLIEFDGVDMADNIRDAYLSAQDSVISLLVGSARKIEMLKLNGCTYTHGTVVAAKPWAIDATVDNGQILDNLVAASLTVPGTVSAAGSNILLRHRQAGAPPAANYANRSSWINTANNQEFKLVGGVWVQPAVAVPIPAGLNAALSSSAVKPSSYPLGLSSNEVAGATGWPSTFGTVMTFIDPAAPLSGFSWQQFTEFESGKAWSRSTANTSDTWGAWLPLTHTPQAAPADLAANATLATVISYINALVAQDKLIGTRV